MMHFAIRNLNQAVTYWPPAAENEFGHAGSGAPVLLMGRWSDKTQQIMRPNGEEVISAAQVILNQDVAVSGFLMKGDHTGSATPPAGAREIQNFTSTPDLRNLESLRKAFL
jgi:hypothetical protein